MNSIPASSPCAALAALLLATAIAAPGTAALASGLEPVPLTGVRADDYTVIRIALRKGEVEKALELALEALDERPEDPVIHDLVGDIYAGEEDPDRAAYYYDVALGLIDEFGDAGLAKQIGKKLAGLDPLQTKCRSWFNGTCKQLEKSAKSLLEEGDAVRAVEVYRALLPYAKGKQRAEYEAVIAEHRGEAELVDMDSAGSGKTAVKRKLIRLQSEHYRFEAYLEPDVLQLLGTTVDNIYAHFVEVFLDGDDSSIAKAAKITIRVFPTKARMLEEYPGEPGGAPEAWWEPMNLRVVAYDTRDTMGTLDIMLLTLFHELTHQFISVLEEQGGHDAPSWLNEGTATYFEVARARVDGSVRWPDANMMRLYNLTHLLTEGGGPSLEQVISFEEPGSYPPEYYCYGWGLVYYFLEYEDPATLERPYRPLFEKYKQRILETGGGSKKVFEEVFLGSPSPLGHKDLDDFLRDWKRWLIEDVKPLYISKEWRTKRLELVAAALAEARQSLGLAADGSKKKKSRKKKAPAELPPALERKLERALTHLEFIQARQNKRDKDEKLDPDLLQQQIEVVRLLRRTDEESRLLEQLLELVDYGVLELDAKTVKQHEARMKSIDRTNPAARGLRSRERSRVKTALKIIKEYEALEPPLPGCAARFATEAYALIADKQLRAELERLEELFEVE